MVNVYDMACVRACLPVTSHLFDIRLRALCVVFPCTTNQGATPARPTNLCPSPLNLNDSQDACSANYMRTRYHSEDACEQQSGT